MRHLIVRLVFGGILGMVAAGACSNWPGVSKNSNNGNPVSSEPLGTCSGTPLPCESLGGADCSASAGCQDLGQCTGVATVVGEACGGELSYRFCTMIGGCAWAPNCTGTPLSCSGVTASACLAVKGCTFTATDGDAGHSSNGRSCNSYGERCTKDANCDCGYTCVTVCPTCLSACGVACQSDAECQGTSSSTGVFTPFCIGLPAVSPYSGICGSSR